MTRLSLVTWMMLATGVLIGCREKPNGAPLATPATIPATPPTPTTNPLETVNSESLNKAIGDQLAKALEQSYADMEKLKLTVYLKGIRDEPHMKSVSAKVEALIDGASGNRSVMTKGGYGDSRLIAISPVANLEAAVAKIDFGAIVAVDLKQRTIVVDAGAESTPRPEAGWPGPTALRQFIGRKLAGWAAENSQKELIQKVGADMAGVVCYPGSTDRNAWADAIDAKLRELAKKHEATVRTSYAYSSAGDFRVATIGPIANLSDAVETLAGSIQWPDEKLRVIVLEPPAAEEPPAPASETPAKAAAESK